MRSVNTLPYAYQRLLEHICVHQYYRGIEADREIGWQEADEAVQDLKRSQARDDSLLDRLTRRRTQDP